jgi:hypothetical protein
VKTWRLINPSDDIVFDADDRAVAAMACVLVGRGMYGADPEGHGGPHVPMWLFGFTEKAWAEDAGRTIADVVANEKPALAACLRSFRLRRGERTSMNDICGRAHEYAERIEASMASAQEVPDGR